MKSTNAKKDLENQNKIFKIKYSEEKFLIKNILDCSNVCKSCIKKFTKKKPNCTNTLDKINNSNPNNIYLSSNRNKNIFKFSFFKKGT
jgi:hypothetical protein